MPAMAAVLVLSFAVIIAKVITQLIGRMNRQINQVSQVKAEALGRLKGAQGQKSVGAKNKMLLDKKKSRLDKKMTRLKKEMGEVKGEESARRKRSEARRVS